MYTKDKILQPRCLMNLLKVREGIEKLHPAKPVLLVAVSKRQSIAAIREAYELGHRDFGENYVQELLEKARSDGELARECPEIRWHFIGTLQSNKIPLLIKGTPNLKSIQSIDTLAKLEGCLKYIIAGNLPQIDLFIQVNLSGEESKHGMKSLEEVIEAYKFGKDRISGLMLIGAAGESELDFTSMLDLKRALMERIDLKECQLSMGMSDDYELAVRMGSDVVRVGTAIFGQRPQ